MTPNLGGPLKEDEQDSYGIYLLILSYKRLALPGANLSSANLPWCMFNMSLKTASK